MEDEQPTDHAADADFHARASSRSTAARNNCSAATKEIFAAFSPERVWTWTRRRNKGIWSLRPPCHRARPGWMV